MRVAIILRGISYSQNYRQGVDFRLSIQSFRTKILTPLKEAGHDISIYLATYPHELQQELLSSYDDALKKYVIYQKEISKGNQRDLSVKALQLLESDLHDIDVVIMTRFDLHYKKNIHQMNIQWDKINVLWKETLKMWNDHNRISDIFHVFPIKFYKQFVDSVAAIRDRSNLHKLYRGLLEHDISKDDVHFMEDGFYDSSTKQPNPVLMIIRGALKPV